MPHNAGGALAGGPACELRPRGQLRRQRRLLGHRQHRPGRRLDDRDTVPLKFRVFNLDDSEVTSTAGIKAWYKAVTCDSGAEIDPELIPAVSTSENGLRRTGDRFHYNWTVPKGAGKCYQVLIQTVDGSTAMISSNGTTTARAFFKAK